VDRLIQNIETIRIERMNMYATRIKVEKMVAKCLSFLVLATLLCCPAFCGEIHDAAKSGDLEKVKALLKENPDLLISKNDKGNTPLHFAAGYGYKAVAELLLAKGADVNAKGNGGQTPLHWACSSQKKDLVELLLDKGADVNAKDNGGATPLLELSGGKDIVELLLAKGADVNAKYDSSGETALHLASCCYADVVQLLLAKGANVNARNKAGETPLHKAAHMNGYKSVVDVLLANKADVNAKDKDGWTPLHRAAQHDYKDVAELLLDYKADVNATNNSGVTPLHEALFYDCDDVVDLLRQHGGQDTNPTVDASANQSGGATFTGNIPVAKKDVAGFYHVSDAMPDSYAFRDDGKKATIRNSFASKVPGNLRAVCSITITEIQKDLAVLNFRADSVPIAFNRTPDDVVYSGIVIGKTANVLYEKPMNERWFLTSDKGKVYCRGQITANYEGKKLAVLLYGDSAMQAMINADTELSHPLASSTQPDVKSTRASLTVLSWDVGQSTAVIRTAGGKENHVTLVKVSAAPSPAAVAILIAP
jgi:ankyrin repeat protein